MDIYLVRHTTVTVGRSVCYGQSDVGLLETYEDEKSRIAALLPDAPLPIWASPLSRCRRLAEDLSTDVRFDDRLKEFHFGDWEGLTWDAIPPDALQTWMADFVHVQVPNGETFQAFYERVVSFWQECIAVQGEQQPAAMAVVTHGGVIRCLLCLLLGLPLQNAYRLHLDYGAVSKVALFPTHATVQYINR